MARLQSQVNVHATRHADSLQLIRDALSGIVEAASAVWVEDLLLKQLKFDDMHHREITIETAHIETFR